MKPRVSFRLLLFLFLLPQNQAMGSELEDIHFAIRAQGARWVAGETSMSALSMAERQRRLGLQLPFLTSGEPVLEAAAESAAAPSLDWRNNGGNYVTPIRDQGSCAGCWAFATTASLESATLIGNGTPGVDLNLSEQVLISCSGAGDCEGGGSVQSASNFIKNTGLPLESCYGYTATDGRCSNACLNWQPSAFKIPSWSWVATLAPTAGALKNALAAYGPLVTTMAVFNDFFSYSSGVYSYTTGALAGYHAVMIIGYSDAGQYFIVKNSWGTSWGEAGYFRIAYSELSSSVKFGNYTIAYAHGRAPIPPAATLVSPSGMIADSRPTYTWSAVSSATSYYPRVDDSTGNKIQQWYTAAEAGCPGGTGTCSVTPDIMLAAGTFQWWVETYNSSGYGPWSDGMTFTVQAGPPPEGAAVVIRETSYPTIQSAYNAAQDGDVIRCRDIVFIEDLVINRDIAVTLEGGYDYGFTANGGGKTSMKGTITTKPGGGRITIRNFILEK